MTDYLVWHSMEDELVCIRCAELDGTRWEENDPGLEEPPEHESCRCFLDIESDGGEGTQEEPAPVEP